jgi:hypothetical protein
MSPDFLSLGPSPRYPFLVTKNLRPSAKFSNPGSSAPLGITGTSFRNSSLNHWRAFHSWSSRPLDRPYPIIPTNSWVSRRKSATLSSVFFVFQNGSGTIADRANGWWYKSSVPHVGKRFELWAILRNDDGHGAARFVCPGCSRFQCDEPDLDRVCV